MAFLVGLWPDLLLDEQVVVLDGVVKDHVGPLRTAADVRPEHDLIRRVPAERLLIRLGCELDVRPAAVDLLLVLDRVLQHQITGLREGFGHQRRETVKLGVLHRLYALVVFIAVPLAGRVLPRAHILRLLPFRGFDPSLLPGVVERFLKKHLPLTHASEEGRDQDRTAR